MDQSLGLRGLCVSRSGWIRLGLTRLGLRNRRLTRRFQTGSRAGRRRGVEINVDFAFGRHVTTAGVVAELRSVNLVRPVLFPPVHNNADVIQFSLAAVFVLLKTRRVDSEQRLLPRRLRERED